MTKKKKKQECIEKPYLNLKVITEKALAEIAIREGKSVTEIRKQIQIAMLSGLLNDDPRIQEQWKRIPCADEIPTPEEVIAFYAEEIIKS